MQVWRFSGFTFSKYGLDSFQLLISTFDGLQIVSLLYADQLKAQQLSQLNFERAAVLN